MTMLQNHRPEPNASQPGRSENGAFAAEGSGVDIGLNAAILSIQDDQPQVLLVRPSGEVATRQDAVPSGPFVPAEHGTLEDSLRYWVEKQTGLPIGYAEQLYTFGDRATQAARRRDGSPSVSIGYLALTRIADAQDLAGGLWRNWYVHFPWEDWRTGKPAILTEQIEPWISAWAQAPQSGTHKLPKPTARPEQGLLPTGIIASTLLSFGSSRATVFLG